jgi:hypothetical protein
VPFSWPTSKDYPSCDEVVENLADCELSLVCNLIYDEWVPQVRYQLELKFSRRPEERAFSIFVK